MKQFFLKLKKSQALPKIFLWIRFLQGISGFFIFGFIFSAICIWGQVFEKGQAILTSISLNKGFSFSDATFMIHIFTFILLFLVWIISFIGSFFSMRYQRFYAQVNVLSLVGVLSQLLLFVFLEYSFFSMEDHWLIFLISIGCFILMNAGVIFLWFSQACYNAFHFWFEGKPSIIPLDCELEFCSLEQKIIKEKFKVRSLDQFGLSGFREKEVNIFHLFEKVKVTLQYQKASISLYGIIIQKYAQGFGLIFDFQAYQRIDKKRQLESFTQLLNTLGIL